MSAPSPARVQQLADDLLRIHVLSPDQHARAVERSLDVGFAREFQTAALTSGGTREIWLQRLLGPNEQPLGPTPGGVFATPSPAPLAAYVPSAPEPPAWSAVGGLLPALGVALLVWGVLFKVSVSSSSYLSNGGGIVNLDLIQTKLTILIFGAASLVSGIVALATGSLLKWLPRLSAS